LKFGSKNIQQLKRFADNGMKAQQAADKVMGVDYGGKDKTILTGVLLTPTKDGKAFMLSEDTIITKEAVERLNQTIQ